jgi:hypothetical protein
MHKLICLLLVSLCSTSYGANYSLLETEYLALEYAQFDKNARDPYAPQYTGRWKDRATLLWDSNLLRVGKYKFMWNHNIHTETIDTGAVKTVGWEWRLGFGLGRYIDVFHHHHSKHIMDERVDNPAYEGKGNQFPVEDSIVIRFKFIDKENNK